MADFMLVDSPPCSPSKKMKLMINGVDIKVEPHTFFDWSEKDMQTLVETVMREVGESSMERNHQLVFKQFDWSRVIVSHFSSEQCHDRWNEICRKVRKYRTAAEIIRDTQFLIPSFASKTIKPLLKDPCRPKKPLSEAHTYLNRHKESFKLQNPHTTYQELQKALFDKYSVLSEKKKHKYAKKYQTELEEWRVLHEEYLVKHPDMRVKSSKKPKMVTPVQLYVTDMVQKHAAEETVNGDELKKLGDKYRSKWNGGLSDGKKMKYIHKALLLHKQYEEELIRYCLKNPKYVASSRPLLNKTEQKLRDKFAGKPDSPPQSGFSMFRKSMKPELESLAMGARMTQVSLLWHQLSDLQRAGWNDKWHQRQQAYLSQLRSYVQSLPEVERTAYETLLKKEGKRLKSKEGKEDKIANVVLMDTESE